MKSKRISPARPLFWGQPWDMDTKMVHSMGDAFSDIYTFTAYENEMGELFLAEWLLIWDIYSFLGCTQYAQGMLSHTWKKQMRSESM